MDVRPASLSALPILPVGVDALAWAIPAHPGYRPRGGPEPRPGRGGLTAGVAGRRAIR
jgi:hypothetical protein